MKFTLSILCLGAVCLSLAGCGGPQMADSNYKGKHPKGERMGAQNGQEASQGQVADAGNFLRSGYAPLDTWMDERFKVRYENMPLDMVFDQKPVSDIRYQKMNLPVNAPLFYLVNANISRREILKQIADFYKLDMDIQMVDGQPSYVVVRGDGPPADPSLAPSGLSGAPTGAGSAPYRPYPDSTNSVVPNPATPTSGQPLPPAPPEMKIPAVPPAPTPYVPSFGATTPGTGSQEL